MPAHRPRNHHATLAAWRQLQLIPPAGATQDEACELARISKLELLKPGETRFGSAFKMFERLLEVKDKAQQYVFSPAWVAAVSAMRGSDKVSPFLGESMGQGLCDCSAAPRPLPGGGG